MGDIVATLTIAEVGLIEVNGETVSGVVLTGPADQVKAAARLLLEQVELHPAGFAQRATTPTLFWDDDGERCYDSPDEFADLHLDGLQDVARIRCAVTLPDQWVASAVLTVDAWGDPDKTESRLFSSAELAAQCFPETLAAARKAARAPHG